MEGINAVPADMNYSAISAMGQEEYPGLSIFIKSNWSMIRKSWQDSWRYRKKQRREQRRERNDVMKKTTQQMSQRVELLHRSSERMMRALKMPRDRRWIKFMRREAWIHLKRSLGLFVNLLFRRNHEEGDL